MSVINIILDINILLGCVAMGLNLFVLGILIGRGHDKDEDEK